MVGDRDFGDNPAIPRIEVAIRWLDWVVRGIDTGIRDEPPIKIFTMGSNQWQLADGWPPSQARYTNYYLHSDGSRHGTLERATG